MLMFYQEIMNKKQIEGKEKQVASRYPVAISKSSLQTPGKSVSSPVAKSKARTRDSESSFQPPTIRRSTHSTGSQTALPRDLLDEYDIIYHDEINEYDIISHDEDGNCNINYHTTVCFFRILL